MAATSVARRRSGSAKSGARRASSRARQVKQRTLVQRTARAGICARGLVYLVLAGITAEIAFSGARGKRASSTGAIDELVHQPAGPVIVAVLAVGLAAYATWRWLQAASGDKESSGWTGVFKRVGWAVVGLVYSALCVRCVVAVFGRSHSSDRSRSYTSRTLELPGGRVILVLVGLGVVAGGIGLMVWAVLQKFETYLPDRKMRAWVDVAARVNITYGNVTRGAVFAGVGASLAIAGLIGRANDARDFDQVLRTLGHHPFGTGMVLLAALGFLAFAVASGLEAAYRRI